MYFLSTFTSILGSESSDVVSSVERMSGINSGIPDVLGNVAFFMQTRVL